MVNIRKSHHVSAKWDCRWGEAHGSFWGLFPAKLIELAVLGTTILENLHRTAVHRRRSDEVHDRAVVMLPMERFPCCQKHHAIVSFVIASVDSAINPP
jgi:hypothetical protein